MPTGTRIRTDNVFGTLTDNPLLIGATTMNGAGLANLAAVSSNHAIIVLDPLRAAGAPEIVIVTAHTASATSATITRGAYGTVARQHASGTLWVHAPTKEDVIQILTSSTRPSDPYRGQLIFETDTNSYVGRDTSDAWQTALPLGAWTAYTPSNTNVTLGNGTQTAEYVRMGRTIHARYTLSFGSTTAFTGTPAFGLPVACPVNEQLTGPVWLLDSGTANYVGVTRKSSSTSVNIHHAVPGSGAGTVAATSPFTWAVGDGINFKITYEAAS